MQTTIDRDRRRHLPHLDLRARGRARRASRSTSSCVAADEPLLFHTGPAGHVPARGRGGGQGAPGRVAALDHLRPRRGRRVRGDEHVAGRGSAAARSPTVPSAACVSLNDLCDRPPRALAEGEVIDLGGKRVRQISTPARAPRVGGPGAASRRRPARCCAATCSPTSAGPARHRPTTSSDRPWSPKRCSTRRALAPHTAPTLRALGDLAPTTLAIMHGSSFRGRRGRGPLRPGRAYELLTLASPAA